MEVDFKGAEQISACTYIFTLVSSQVNVKLKKAIIHLDHHHHLQFAASAWLCFLCKFLGNKHA